MRSLNLILKYNLIKFNCKHKHNLSFAKMSEKTAKRIKLEEENDQQTLAIHKHIKIIENQVAITEYINTHRGFSGILKQRYSDFIVHELDKDGNLVELNDCDLPEEVQQEESEINNFNEKTELENFKKITDEILNEQVWTEINDVVDGKTEQMFIDVTSFDKTQRTAIHRIVKEKYSNLITSTTGDESEKKIIVKKREGKSDERRRSNWPSNRPLFVHFTLYQENQGSFDTLSALARVVNRRVKDFSIAGSKDKRSISSQRVCIHKINPKSLLGANKVGLKRAQAFAVGNIKFENDKLRLGDLSGNHFDIVNAVESVSENGFINYFGTQRFGLSHIPTYKIGLAILKEDFKEAVNLILAKRPFDFKPHRQHDKLSFNECIQLYKETEDAGKVLKVFSWPTSNEAFLLRSLAKSNQNKNYFNAIAALPRNNRTLYLHSYQSYVWNQLVSYRVKQYGFKVTVGDLILPDLKEQVDIDDDVDCIDEDCNDEEMKSKHVFRKPIVVDENNINTASIYDIVIPLPGAEVIFPKNTVKQKLFEILAKDEITIENFNSKSKMNMLYGTYRKVFVKPKNFSWSMKSYNSPNYQCLLTDTQKLSNFQEKLNSFQSENTEEKEYKHKLLHVSFSLPPSSYATILIRELLKKDIMEYSLSNNQNKAIC